MYFEISLWTFEPFPMSFLEIMYSDYVNIFWNVSFTEFSHFSLNVEWEQGSARNGGR